ncbi:hypothetical protein TNCV_1375991 [Trichonephila clavipes]|nr:hypothetical protein TNCV_1375991 [Trichonephila clavipes]
MGPPHTNTIAQIESRSEDNLIPFHCKSIPSCARVSPLQTGTSLKGVIGSTLNGRCGTKCLPVRRFLMVREDTEACCEGAACVWTATNEAVGSTRACHVM